MNLSIRARIIFISAAVLLLAIGANTVIGGFFFVKEYTASIKSHASVLSKGLKTKLEKVLSLGVPIESITGFEEQCRDVVANNEGISYAVVVTPQGKILFHDDPAHQQAAGERPVLNSAGEPLQGIIHYTNGAETYFESIEPVFDAYGHYVGAVRLGFPHSYITQKTRKLTSASAGVSVVSLLLSAVLLYAGISTWVTYPLGRLLASIREIRSRGPEAAVAVPAATGGELGELSDAFNDMIRTIQAKTVSRDYADTIVRNMMDALVVASPERRIITVNRALCRLMGHREGDLVGRAFGDLFRPAFEAPGGQDIEELAFEGALKGTEAYVRSREGKIIPVLMSCSVVRGEGGEMVCLVCTAQDITERKAREEEFLKAQKLESIGLLAGGIAHDFNNLLTAIMGNVTLARLHTDPDTRPYARLTEAEKAALRAKDLTQQLLTFSKGGDPIKKAVSIRELVREAAAFALRGANVKCDLSLPDDLWAVSADEGQLGQVIHNLIINADHAMPQGGTITVSGTNIILAHRDFPQLPDGRYVRLAVEDHGIGIPEEHIKKIFDPYFTTKAKGSGLGLATTYSIVKRHGGHIEVTSTPGAGTTFHVYLTAAEGAAPAPPIEEITVPRRGTGRILVMDDEEIIRDVATEMLKELGYDAVATADGAEAIERYREALVSDEPFRAVIMDLTVPGGMGGVEAVSKLIELDPNVKAIVSSGYSNDPVMSDYRRYGFSGIVAKPYQLKNLGEAVARLVA